MLNVNALKAEIVRNGLTQTELAEMLGIAPITFGRKLKNSAFGIDEAYRMIKLLNIEHPSEIFFADE